MASIFNLLENKDASPLSIVNSKVTLLEHITGKTLENKPKNFITIDYFFGERFENSKKSVVQRLAAKRIF